MKYAFILLLALFCYAQLVSSGGRGGRRGRRRGQLEKDIANLGEDINCLMEEMKKCKSEIKGLNDKFSEMLTMLYKSKCKSIFKNLVTKEVIQDLHLK